MSIFLMLLGPVSLVRKKEKQNLLSEFQAPAQLLVPILAPALCVIACNQSERKWEKMFFFQLSIIQRAPFQFFGPETELFWRSPCLLSICSSGFQDAFESRSGDFGRGKVGSLLLVQQYLDFWFPSLICLPLFIFQLLHAFCPEFLVSLSASSILNRT